MFVARTAMSTTKEIVEGCLEYLAGIKGVATCCTPPEKISSGEVFSLSWRVQVESSDLDKALLPSSWKSGWAVKPYYFRHKKQDSLQLNQGQDALSKFLTQGGLTHNGLGQPGAPHGGLSLGAEGGLHAQLSQHNIHS